MFDIGWPELFIIAVLAIVVVGPKELPRAIRTVSTAIRKLKGMAREFQSGIDDMVREAELDDLKKEMNAAVPNDIGKTIEQAVDPTGEIGRELKIEDTGPGPVRSANKAAAGMAVGAVADQAGGSGGAETPAADPVRAAGGADIETDAETGPPSGTPA